MNTKKWQHAGITNDFVFNSVMQNRKLSLHLIQAVLPKLNIKKALHVNTQQEFNGKEPNKAVRLDVFVEDNQHRIYDVEMQVTNRRNFGKRTRYYQSMMDLNALEKGENYADIKQSYIIFFFTFDPEGYDHVRYTFSETCEEIPNLRLDTGAKVIFLNSKGKIGREQEDINLQSFFDLMNGFEKNSAPLSQEIKKEIQVVKRDKTKEREFMSYELRLQDAREEGIEQGIKEDQLRVAKKLYKQLKNDGQTSEYIKKTLNQLFKDNLTEIQIKKILNESDN